MKIAQIAPLIESVPPRLYGGTERIVSYITEELIALGHDVTLFASGDSITAANLVPCVPKALRLDASVRDTIPYYMLMLDRVRQRADEFDILHFHIDQFHFPCFDIVGRTVTTLHGRQTSLICTRFMRVPTTCRWSRSPTPSVAPYRTFILWARLTTASQWACIARPSRTAAILPFSAASLRRNARTAPSRSRGRWESSQDRSQGGPRRRGLFPHADRATPRGRGVEFIGEINDQQKSQFLGGAQALLFPIDWRNRSGSA
jgi:glycosyltransferase involved in cell wall biosynthesis